MMTRALKLLSLTALSTFLSSSSLLTSTGCIASEPPPVDDECSTAEDCGQGETCTAVGASESRVCAAVCGADQPCPEGGACISVAGEAVCAPIIGSGANGDPCDVDVDCDSGACIGDDGLLFCASLCESTEQDCEGTERCHLVGLRKVCLEPLDNRANGSACDSPRECLSGRCLDVDNSGRAECVSGCIDGTCLAEEVCVDLTVGTNACVKAIADGEPCIGPARCSGGLCLEDVDGSQFCTQSCDALQAVPCQDNWFCVASSPEERVCLPPLDSRARAAACDDNRECESGQCVTFTDNNGDVISRSCTVFCSEGCLDQEMCWPNAAGEDVCGPLL